MVEGPKLAIGCAMWSLPTWEGVYVPKRADRAAVLAHYAAWCTAVEGNTTFYAVPQESTVAAWADAVPEGFEFCFKLPRTITHDRRLRNAEPELAEFVDRMAPLGDHLGPTWVQLPPTFGPDDLDTLDGFLAALPTDRPWAVEVRNKAFEAEGRAERALHDLLHARDVDRVIIDTRAVFDGPRETPAEIEAWERKPRLRVRPIALGDRPTVRFIGQTNGDANPAYWAPWVSKVADWLREGRRPMVFVHTPDNAVAPALARAFHAEVAAAITELAPLPEPIPIDEQLGMF